MWLSLIGDVCIAGALAFGLWVPLGRWILGNLGGGCFPSGAGVLLALGMGCWGLCILVLGVFNLLYRPALLGLAVLLFLTLKLYRHLLSGPRPAEWIRPPDRSKLFSAGLSLLSLFYVLLALGSSRAPELSFDALNVHLPYARDAAASHRVGFAPNNWSSAMPALPLMSYITAFVFSGPALAKLLNVLCYLASGGVAFWFARRWWGPTRALAAAALFWSCPVALYEATTALIDLPLTLYSAVAVFALLEWARRDETPFLWLSAVSLGLAIGCKYHALFWVPAVAAVVAWHVLRTRKDKVKRALGLLFRYGLVTAALWAPWLLRAWIYTGNPVFPLANGVFESPYFTPAMESAARAAYANEGVGRSLLSLIQLPWTVTFDPGPFRGTLGAIFLVGVALTLPRRKQTFVRFGLLSAGLFFFAWALTAQEIRYLLPMVPLLAVLSVFGILGPGRERGGVRAGGVPRLGERAARLSEPAGKTVIVLGALMALPPIYSRLITDWTYWHAYTSPLPYLMGRETAQQFLERDVPSIYVYDFINESLGPENRVLLLNDAARFYAHIPTLYSFTVEGERILSEKTEDGVLNRLKESGISHVLLNYNGIAPLPGVQPREGVYFFLDDDFQRRHMVPLFSKNNVTLYQVLAP